MKNADQFCEYILFTTNDSILKKIEEYDWVKNFKKRAEIDPDLMVTARLFPRPMTSSKDNEIGEDGRPVTAVIPPLRKRIKPCIVGQTIKIKILDS